ncbi:MAG: DUF3090 family protein [Candidatus Tectomicrobia bacterium]|nr:DUF3090 family protein [Candidatus Tectomicrobia bacterium]
MEAPRYNIGQTLAFTPEAIGVPGKRAFRLVVEASHGAAVLWLEKEQLYGLALTIQRLAAARRLPSSATWEIDEGDLPEPAYDKPEVEFKIGKLVLGYRKDEDAFVFSVFDAEELGEEEERPVVMFAASREQLAALAKDSISVCWAGRPVCPLCHTAIESPQHICAQFNGHNLKQ